MGLQQINADHNIFVSAVGINGPIVSIFINDIKIMRAKNFGIISQIKEKLTAAFKMLDMEPISLYFDFKIS